MNWIQIFSIAIIGIMFFISLTLYDILKEIRRGIKRYYGCTFNDYRNKETKTTIVNDENKIQETK